MGRARQIAFVAGATAVLAYLFDPAQGRRRRALARDRLSGLWHRGRRTAERRRRYLGGKVEGIAHQADLTREEQPPPDDVTLARKVETIIFRDPVVPKGQIVVGAAGGVVTLRGEAPTPDMIRRLEREVAGIPGVRAVENLLHLPGTAAPESSGSA